MMNLNLIALYSIFFIPLLSSLFIGLFGKYLERKTACYISVIFITITMLFSLYSFYFIGLKSNTIYLQLYQWVKVDILIIDLGLYFDSLTVTMLVIITLISTLVHLYSTDYMSEDPALVRFMSYLTLFTFFMIILVTAGNFLQMFFGWEGVGLCSYLLINFWYTRIQANKSAMKAIIVNKIGDIGILMAMVVLFYYFKTLDYSIIFTLIPFLKNKTMLIANVEYSIIDVISLSLFIGAMAKSAQIGLHTWLPDAMEGPTPVSALIHAATMVTAGVFLIIRCSPIFEYSPNILVLITFIGAITAFFAAIIGVFQNDLKKVIAYSTCSQLGYMIFSCGLSNYSVSLFHLFNHAFFKALLFLSAGSIIHAMSDEQDMRRMGGLIKIMPITYIMILIGSLALMGFPFLTGFYSKDIIIELAYSKYLIMGRYIHWFSIMTAFLTAFYSIKLIYLTFIVPTNSYKVVIKSAKESGIKILIPLIILGFFSIFIGYLCKDMFIGLGTDFFANSIFSLDKNIILLQSEFIPIYIKMIPLFSSILAIILYNFLKFYIFNKKLYDFFNKKWYLDYVYNIYVVKYILNLGNNITFKILDKGFIELIGPEGLSTLISNFSKYIRKEQINYTYYQLYYLFLGSIFINLLIMIFVIF